MTWERPIGAGGLAPLLAMFAELDPALARTSLSANAIDFMIGLRPTG